MDKKAEDGQVFTFSVHYADVLEHPPGSVKSQTVVVGKSVVGQADINDNTQYEVRTLPGDVMASTDDIINMESDKIINDDINRLPQDDDDDDVKTGSLYDRANVTSLFDYTNLDESDKTEKTGRLLQNGYIPVQNGHIPNMDMDDPERSNDFYHHQGTPLSAHQMALSVIPYHHRARHYRKINKNVKGNISHVNRTPARTVAPSSSSSMLPPSQIPQKMPKLQTAWGRSATLTLQALPSTHTGGRPSISQAVRGFPPSQSALLYQHWAAQNKLPPWAHKPRSDRVYLIALIVVVLLMAMGAICIPVIWELSMNKSDTGDNLVTGSPTNDIPGNVTMGTIHTNQTTNVIEQSVTTLQYTQPIVDHDTNNVAVITTMPSNTETLENISKADNDRFSDLEITTTGIT